MGPSRQPLAPERWHFQHGPIDLVIGADGDPQAVTDAHESAWQRFSNVLPELVRERTQLRQAVAPDSAAPCPLHGPVARRMWTACAPFRHGFITPMAAVAGAVAQEIVAHYHRPGITRAWVNNGGDIALHLAPGHSVRVGLWSDLARFDGLAPQRALPTDAQFAITADLPVRGVATSGWRGRSLSLGIADSVTVLAVDAASADAAATVVANAVNVDGARITRRPANVLRDNSDLGDLLVTVDVPVLPAAQVEAALQAGLDCALALQARGLIWQSALVCQGRWRSTDATGMWRLVQ